MPRPKNSGAPAVTARQIAYCLKHLHDGTALRQSPLVRLPNVARLATERYRGSYWGHASALRDILLETCAHLEAGMDSDPQAQRIVTFLQLYTQEISVSDIARRLGVSRPSVYRFIMPDAFALVAEEVQRDVTHPVRTG